MSNRVEWWEWGWEGDGKQLSSIHQLSSITTIMMSSELERNARHIWNIGAMCPAICQSLSCPK